MPRRFKIINPPKETETTSQLQSTLPYASQPHCALCGKAVERVDVTWIALKGNRPVYIGSDGTQTFDAYVSLVKPLKVHAACWLKESNARPEYARFPVMALDY